VTCSLVRKRRPAAGSDQDGGTRETGRNRQKEALAITVSASYFGKIETAFKGAGRGEKDLDKPGLLIGGGGEKRERGGGAQ